MRQIFSIANIVLFIVAALVALVAGLIVVQLGGDKLSAVLTCVAAGIVGTMLIGGVASACKWEFESNPIAGAVGSLVGMLSVYLFL